MAESLVFWEGIASDWDKAIGDAGVDNDYWTHLQEPVLRRMLGHVCGEQALDLATGNGIVARWLARDGVSVLGTDGSQRMVDIATARTFVGETAPGKVRFQRLDLLSEAEVDEFAAAQLVALVCLSINASNLLLTSPSPMDSTFSR
jgi:SAM-dependent methyltransferase